MNRIARIFVVMAVFLSACSPEEKPTDVHDGPVKGNVTITGKVVDNNDNPLEGVVVSDCFRSVRTDADGVFELDSDLDVTDFVFVSIPAGYSVPVKNGIPLFFKRLSEESKADGKYILEFILSETGAAQDRYSLLIAADPQPRTAGRAYDRIAYHSLDCCNDLYRDMREKAGEIRKSRPCYGIVLGDIVHEDMNLFDRYITDGLSKMAFPTFNVLGNHDNDYSASTDAEGARVFESKFGPANYSFNIGKVHYVVLDNLIMTEEGGKLSGAYSQGLRDDIWHWLQSDLAFVDKNTTIMVCAHSPMFMQENGNDRCKTARNGSGYASLLSSYKKVYAWAGHTHSMFNYVYGQNTTMKNIEVHTLSRSTGELWTNEYLSNGTPRGYVVVDVDGEDVSWKFRPLPYQTAQPVAETPDYVLRAWDYDDEGVAVMKGDGALLDESYQMNVYARGQYGDNYVYANIFMWDEMWEDPVFISNSGGTPTVMKPVSDSGYMFDAGQKEIFDFYKETSGTLRGQSSYSWETGGRKRLFRAYSAKKSDSGRIEVTDRFGNIYSTEISW